MLNLKTFRFMASLFAIFFLTTTLAFSQVTTGSITGVVRDVNNAVVSGANVTVTNTATGIVRQTTTNEDGIYRVTNLNPGQNYQVEVAATGFESKIVQNIEIRLAVESSVNVDLGVQGVGGTVTVTGESPLINTTQSQLSTSYSQQQLQQLPYNGGSIDNLALLTPGVITPGDADFTNGVGISANGNRGRSNNFQLDGQDNNDNSVAGPTLTITNSEAIGDYQVTTNNPSAEFGRNAGAQVNVITRSGTNSFRGSLFEFYQGNKLNARNNLEKKDAAVFNFLSSNGFANQFQGLANRNGQSVFDYNRFGGSLGGPIVKNRAFFFATYQQDIQNGETFGGSLGSGAIGFGRGNGFQQVLGDARFPGARGILGNTVVGGGPAFASVPGQFILVPQTQDTNGDGVPDAFVNSGGAFTNSLFVCSITPVNGAPCPTANRIALQTGEGIRIVPNRYRESQFITREDINLTDKDSLVVRYIFDKTKFPNSAATGTTVTGAFFDVPSKNNNLGATYTRTISSRFVNEARFNFSRLDVKFGDPDGPLPGPGISFNGQRDLAGNFFSQGFGTANNLPQSRKVDVYQEQDTFRASLGNHSVSVGFDLRQQKVDNFFLPNFLGSYRFGPGGTLPGGQFFNEFGCDRRFVTNSDVDPDLPNPCAIFVDPDTGETNFLNSALGFENLLLNRPNRVNFALGNPRIKTSQNDYFFFVQDDYRVRPNLTLNLGLRYEYSSTPFNPIIDAVNAREANSATSIFDPKFALETRTVQRLKTDKNNFAPRVGLAYTPNLKFLGGSLGNFFDARQTVLRAGFGIAYDPSFFNIVLNTVTAAPFAASGTVNQTPGAPDAVNFPFLPRTTAQLNLTPGTNGGDPRLFNQTRVDPGFYNPYTMQYSVGIQQELFKNSVLEVRYVGSRIVGQFQTVNGNPSLRILNYSAQCLGLAPGAFTGGAVVGSPATATVNAMGVVTSSAQRNACLGGGFNNRPGTNGNGRVDPNFGAVRLRTNGASATYNGLQTRFDTRFSDVVINANYTFSKTIDNASEIFSTFGGGQTVAQSENPFNTTSGERGLSAFHQKHNFTANFIYQVPFFKDQQGFIGKALGGFQVSGIVRLASGRPYTPQNSLGFYDVGFESAFVGSGALRPYNGNSNAPDGTIAIGYTSACVLLFNDPVCNSNAAVPGTFILYNTRNAGSRGTVVTAAQALQQARLIYNDSGIAAGTGLSSLISSNCAIPGAFGCAEGLSLFRTPFGIGRNTFFGNNFYTVNLGVFKTTNITERFRIEFRAEASNLFNERNFGVPDPFTEDAFGSTAVGSFQNPGFNSGSSRELRFGVRFLF